MMGTPRTNRGVWWFFGSDIQLFIIRLIVFAICWYRLFLDLVASKEAIVFPFKYNLVLKKFIYFSLSSALTIYYFERVASLRQLS